MTKHVNLSLSTLACSTPPMLLFTFRRFHFEDSFSSKWVLVSYSSMSPWCPKINSSSLVSYHALLRQSPFVLLHLLLHPGLAPFHRFIWTGSSIAKGCPLMGLGSLEIGIDSRVCLRVTGTGNCFAALKWPYSIDCFSFYPAS